jgi:hypothetical protein
VSRFLRQPIEPDMSEAPAPRRSVYDDRSQGTGPVAVVMTHTGRFLGLERDGHFEPTQPCCPDPRSCERGECWTALEGSRGL